MTPAEIMEKWPHLLNYSITANWIGWGAKIPIFESKPFGKGYLINIYSFMQVIDRANDLRVIKMEDLPRKMDEDGG
ncbi:MAG: hypothetical protein H6581_20520 [Bacteroidia bacterium]|nr:hypothetical protein [Bacteroidia bacterium]